MAIDTASEVRDYKNYVRRRMGSGRERRDLRHRQPRVPRETIARVPEDEPRGRPGARSTRRARDLRLGACGPSWPPTSAPRIMLSVVEKFTEHEDELAALETAPVGA